MISALMALTLSTGAAVGPAGSNCSWDRPGHNPFMGDVVAAVDRYTDIPADVRARLKDRMARRQYDDMVDIRRDRISGKGVYDPTIRDMHFGAASVCNSVDRSAWQASAHERGLVYCEGSECILVPTVCRNVSRISRAAAPPLMAAAAPPAGDDELAFAPPGAGVSAPEAAAPAPSFEGQSVPSTGLPVSELPGGDIDVPPPGSGPPPELPPNFPVFPPIPGGLNPPVIVPPPLPIPEPRTWAMWLAGLLALGHVGVVKRRRLS